MGKKIKEVFFDWDGTFADTEGISIAVTRQVLLDHANDVLGISAKEQLDAIDMRGRDFGQIVKQFQDAVNAGLPENRKVALDAEDLRHNKLRPAAKDALLTAKLSPGIVETTKALQEQDLGLAVVSNSPRLRIQPLIDKHGLDDRIPRSRLFSAFDDTAGKLKDDPAIYLLAAKTLGISPEEAVAVEDSLNGMRAARAAGIGLRVGYVGLTDPEFIDSLREELFKAGADIVIDDMRKLPKIVAAYNKQVP